MRYIGYLALLVCTVLLMSCGNVAEGVTDRFPTPLTPTPGTFQPDNSASLSSTTITFPQDELPHNVLTEWWYYTGHLNTDTGRQYGFQFVIFQSQRGTVSSPIYAAHFAVTDIQNQQFAFDQRIASGPSFDPKNLKTIDLYLGDWKLQGLNGHESLAAQMTNGAYSLSLNLDGSDVLLEGGKGVVDLGPSGVSGYYSRPRMAASGTLTDHGAAQKVTGIVWADHQWGNFLPTGSEGGWDWFSTQLSDGSNLAFWRIRDASGKATILSGTYLTPDGRIVATLQPKDLDIRPVGTWKSPIGVTYPSSFDVHITGVVGENLPDLQLRYTPLVANQELDTRASTGTIYWEGATAVTGTKDGAPITGQSYVELTGYAATGASPLQK